MDTPRGKSIFQLLLTYHSIYNTYISEYCHLTPNKESCQRMSLCTPSPSKQSEVTPNQQAYAACKNFLSDIRGENKLEVFPILTNKGHQSLESIRRMADVDGDSRAGKKFHEQQQMKST
jgi:hypothetical protein